MLRLLVLTLLFALLAPATVSPASAPAILIAPGADDDNARAEVARLPRATFVNDQDGDKLFDELERAYAEAPGASLAILVSFRDDAQPRAALAGALRAAGVEAERVFTIVPGFATRATLAQAERIARLPDVRQVELNHVARPELETSTAVMGADAVVDEMGVTGEGITIAILDTGFDGDHVDLGDGKIVHFVDMESGKEGKAFDTNGHGTHVASIAAGLGRGDAAYRGVAPGASVVGLRITDEDDAIAGYEWIVEHREHYNIRIATMSFGFGAATDGTTLLERTVDAAWDAGIVCFKSNGNSGPGRSTMTVPAAARGILGIGSILDPAGSPAGVPLVGNPGLPLPAATGFILSGFSSRGPTTDGRIKPDLIAPGQAITAASNGTKDGYITFSGTSMASPFAAGSAALVLDANPALAPDDVKRILIATAEDRGLAGPDIDYGHGRIRVREAVRAAFAWNGTEAPASAEPPVPFHETRTGVVAIPFAEGTVEINDTTHPIAATFIAEGAILQVEMRGPDGGVVGRLAASTPSRQQTLGFDAPTPGTYTYRIVAQPGVGLAPRPTYVVDFSHGLAPALPTDITAIGGLLEGIAPAAAVGDANVPAAPVLIALLGAAALVLARRR